VWKTSTARSRENGEKKKKFSRKHKYNVNRRSRGGSYSGNMKANNGDLAIGLGGTLLSRDQAVNENGIDGSKELEGESNLTEG